MFNAVKLQKKIEPAERLITAAAKLAKKQGHPELKFKVSEVGDYLRLRGRGAHKNAQGFVDHLIRQAAGRKHIKPVQLPSVHGEVNFTN